MLSLRLSLVLAAVCSFAAMPVAAQESADEEEDSERHAQIKALRDEWQPEPLTCDPPDPPLADDVRKRIEVDAVSDELAFDCEYDWLKVEGVLQAALPRLGEPGLGSYEATEAIKKTIAMRQVTIAYGSVSAVESVLCHFGDHPRYRFKVAAIGGTARFANLWKSTSTEEDGIWELSLTASDCEFFIETLKTYRPDDIVHNKPFGNPLTGSGEIILVHGESFIEFLDHWGEYSVKLRPGLTEDVDAQSEKTEAALSVMLRYLAHRARAEGVRRELPPSVQADEAEAEKADD
jgi:hypothetical protein